MSVLAVITARGGSKGIFRKNTKLLAGKPLIAWTIEAARQATCVDRVVVSTDDDEIRSVALRFGADVPFIRPAPLASDSATSIDTLFHAISYFPEYDWILLLQPTSPLRSAGDIDGIWELSQSKNVSSVVSLCEALHTPSLIYHFDDGDFLVPLYDAENFFNRRQDFKPAYALNGALYLAKRDWLYKHKKFIGPDTAGYVMPQERSVDIDTEYDWLWAEFLIGQWHG